MTSTRWLRIVAGVSLVYDLAIGLALLTAAETVARWFAVPLPSPILFVKLDAIFLVCVGAGYALPLRDPARHRAYLWIFGVALKAAGAAAFVVDHLVNGSPASFLIFAAGDGGLSLLTLAALLL